MSTRLLTPFLPQWSTRGQPGQSLTPTSSQVTVIDTEPQESMRTSAVPSKTSEDTGWGILYPFFLGHLITVPNCPAFTSCSSHISPFECSRWKQTSVSMFYTQNSRGCRTSSPGHTSSVPQSVLRKESRRFADPQEPGWE